MAAINKLIKQLIVIAIFLLLLPLSECVAQYTVRVGAFNKHVSGSYFFDRGLKDVRSETKQNFVMYYYGDYGSSSEAQAALTTALSKGFDKAKVVNLEELRANCPPGCGPNIIIKDAPLPPPAPILVQYKPAPVIEPMPVAEYSVPLPPRLQNIFFDFDQAFLRPESIYNLNTLSGIMGEHPDYTVEAHAHTDSKGSYAYNEALSEARKEAVVRYLIMKGLEEWRVKGFTYGEASPIAKNKIGGEDAPDGRQLNRRVELKVKSSNQPVDIVDEIEVPAHLQLNGVGD